MPVELSHLMMLAIGTKPELKVGDLPRPVAEYLGCHPAVVFLGYKEFQKIAKKHDKIRREEFQTLPIMIKKGRYIKDAGRRNCVTVFYSDPDSGNIYTAGIKSACQGAEV